MANSRLSHRAWVSWLVLLGAIAVHIVPALRPASVSLSAADPIAWMMHPLVHRDTRHLLLAAAMFVWAAPFVEVRLGTLRTALFTFCVTVIAAALGYFLTASDSPVAGLTSLGAAFAGAFVVVGMGGTASVVGLVLPGSLVLLVWSGTALLAAYLEGDVLINRPTHAAVFILGGIAGWGLNRKRIRATGPVPIHSDDPALQATIDRLMQQKNAPYDVLTEVARVALTAADTAAATAAIDRVTTGVLNDSDALSRLVKEFGPRLIPAGLRPEVAIALAEAAANDSPWVSESFYDRCANDPTVWRVACLRAAELNLQRLARPDVARKYARRVLDDPKTSATDRGEARALFEDARAEELKWARLTPDSHERRRSTSAVPTDEAEFRTIDLAQKPRDDDG